MVKFSSEPGVSGGGKGAVLGDCSNITGGCHRVELSAKLFYRILRCSSSFGLARARGGDTTARAFSQRKAAFSSRDAEIPSKDATDSRNSTFLHRTSRLNAGLRLILKPRIVWF